MPDLVSRNTIKLASNALSTDNAYNGYTIELSRYNTVTGRLTTQRRLIIAYNGANRVATIDGLWDADFIPDVTDTYKIVPTYADARVTTNFAMHTLDYITSVRYGKGLRPFTDLYMPSWLESGRICDARSDVTVQVSTSISGVVIGDVYRYPDTGNILFQGKVAEKKTVNGENFVRFTDVLGKLANKWNSWKVFEVNAIIYEEDRLYYSTVTGVKPIRPVHTTGTVGGIVKTAARALTRSSGTGTTSLTLINDKGNPVRDVNAAGLPISGYSLYDADGIDYWRYVGWDEHAQRYVTRHQGNLIIDTSIPVFDNINSLLDHFGGILRYTGGKYHLEVEEREGVITPSATEVRHITADNIIDNIKITDEGIRGSYNSLTVAYEDPGNKFEGKNISFFNSNFLKADRNVPKKGNVSIPGITNYYNARILADKFLTKSRFGMTVNLNIPPRGVLLLAGKVIQIRHPKYGWLDKKFRIENLTHNPDCTVDIVCKEYDDSFYAISNVSRPPATALAGESNTTTSITPGGLKTTGIDSNDETIAGIELSWDNAPGMDSTVSTEIFSSRRPNLFVTGTSVISDGTWTTQTNHNLQVNDAILSQSDKNGLEFNKQYYVRSVAAPNKFQLSETEGGAVVNTFTPEAGLSVRFITASVIATVPAPINSYIDIITAGNSLMFNPIPGTDRVEKYYWIRHKITTE